MGMGYWIWVSYGMSMGKVDSRACQGFSLVSFVTSTSYLTCIR